MKGKFHLDSVLKAGVVILTLLTGALCYLNIQVDKTLSSTREEMVESVLKRYEMGLAAARGMLLSEAGGPLRERLEADAALRERLRRLLSYFTTEEVEHLFLITKDGKGHLRFLLDAERDPSQRALFMQRFEPLSPVWEEVFQSAESRMIRHTKDDRLWVTIALPIVENGRVAAVLGEDLSALIHSDIQGRFSKIRKIALGIILVMAALLLFGYFQIYVYFRGRKKSFIDPLTGAYNRQFFYEVLARLDYTRFKIIIFDIDHFKKVNDTYGHDVGDRVLSMVKSRVAEQLRETDYLVRIGGEEFLIFLRARDDEEVKSIAERIRHAVASEPFVVGDKALTITISLGINTDLNKVANIDEAIQAADEYLYCAKRNGRNRVCFNGSVVSGP